MKKLLPLLILLTACAGENYRKSAADEKVKAEDDYSWVDQLNFDKKVGNKISS
jgi:hypothetical protein